MTIADDDLAWGRTVAMAHLRSLVDYRKDAGLPAARIAEAMGVRPSVVYRLETAERDPRLSTLLRYARVLGLEVDIVRSEEADAA